eukprot:CAMPEP_0172805694 /NCGR_PEP_ID=MMETSP1075-20121228/5896_1 /TAXON_ID=2916 /ORGANISM="Ceratium fusus, Strain PA161109" /LENGTH=33 /DNA_ID= /DNA_START= /DNA_END= /DNA_ORIENTATION=
MMPEHTLGWFSLQNQSSRCAHMPSRWKSQSMFR